MFAARSTSFPLLSAKNTVRLIRSNAAYCAGVLALVSASVGLADVYSFECDSLPTSSGWTLNQVVCDPQQFSEDGHLFQEVPLCEENPEWSTRIDHEKDIEDLGGLTSWFIEWRMMTTGISEEIPFVAPAALVAFDGNGMTYHFTIADDRVRFIRDLELPILYFDIVPGMRTFRVELFGVDLGETYVVYIDGEIVDSGETEGPFFNPPWQAGVKFRAKSNLVPSVSTWTHIRWGPLQNPGSADYTLNGEVDFDDLPFFHECLTTEAGGWAGCVWADMDFDGQTDCGDWALFVEAWSAPTGAPCSLTCGDCDPADFNEDGVVGPFDLATLLASWGPCPDCDECPSDLNDDCNVGPADLAMLLGSWG